MSGNRFLCGKRRLILGGEKERGLTLWEKGSSQKKGRSVSQIKSGE